MVIKLTQVSAVLFIVVFTLVGCDAGNEKLFARKLIEANNMHKNGNTLAAISKLKIMDKDFPDRFDVCAYILGLRGYFYELEVSQGTFSEIQQNIIQEDIVLVKECLNRFLALDAKEKTKNMEIFFGFMWGVNIYSEFELSVKLFDEYYDENIYISHPRFRYSVIHYAEALANLGQFDKGKSLFLRSIAANKTDQTLRKKYITYLSDFKSPEDGVSYANDYLKNVGFSDWIHHELCLSYYKASLTEKGRECFQELINISKHQDIYADYLEDANDYLNGKK